jgi:hypothetical protein
MDHLELRSTAIGLTAGAALCLTYWLINKLVKYVASDAD